MVATEKTHELANVAWSFSAVAPSGCQAVAWNTDTGSRVAEAEGESKIDAGKRLYQALAKQVTGPGYTLVGRNGDRLTADGPLNLRGEISNEY